MLNNEIWKVVAQSEDDILRPLREETYHNEKQAVDAATALSEKYPSLLVFVEYINQDKNLKLGFNPPGTYETFGRPW